MTPDVMLVIIGMLLGAFVCSIGAAAATSRRVRQINERERRAIIDEARAASAIVARNVTVSLVAPPSERATANIKPNTPKLPAEERPTAEYDPDRHGRESEP